MKSLASDYLARADIVFPTDNDFGIPKLLPEMQAQAVVAPINSWGRDGRAGLKSETIHFYTDDYRFSALWSNPGVLEDTEISCACEPNFSIYDVTPRAVGLYQIYRKRWLARYMQSIGIRVFVDLNVSEHVDDINLIGVPRGWRAYSTRAYAGKMDALGREWDIARRHSGCDIPLMLVIGGGKEARRVCMEIGAVHAGGA